MKIPEEMFKKCLNIDKIVFHLMDEDVKNMLITYSRERGGRCIDYYDNDYNQKWIPCYCIFSPNIAYRINPEIAYNDVDTLLNRCFNPDKKMFADLDNDVQDELQRWMDKYGNTSLEIIDAVNGKWYNVSYLRNIDNFDNQRGRIFRLSKEFYDKISKKEIVDKPTADKTAFILLNVPISKSKSGIYVCSIPDLTKCNMVSYSKYFLSTAICHKDFCKIEYETKKGNSIYSTSIDFQLGTPVFIVYKIKN
jgi:hypothetical protein